LLHTGWFRTIFNELPTDSASSQDPRRRVQIGVNLNSQPDRPLLIASGNTNKHREISQALNLSGSRLLTPRDLEADRGPAPDPQENGATLLENAIIKASEFSRWSGLMSLADDTGLFVDALDGDPGIYSARYAGENATFADNIEKLLEQLAEKEGASRAAHFSCVLALCDGDEVILSVEGRCQGIITESPRGEGGFGYDPIFLPQGAELTFSQMAPEEKNRISHRGLAVQQFSQLYGAAISEGEKS